MIKDRSVENIKKKKIKIISKILKKYQKYLNVIERANDEERERAIERIREK